MHLEIQYKSKIEAGRTILCTTEVESQEGRKLWMKVRWAHSESMGAWCRGRMLPVPGPACVRTEGSQKKPL